MTADNHELLERAAITLLCALAFDEAQQCGAPPDELVQLRGYWVDDAQRIVDEAEELGLLDDGLDDNHFDEEELNG